MRDQVSQSAQSNRWKLRREIGAGEDAGLRTGNFASLLEMLPYARGVEEERESVDSFLLYSMERFESGMMGGAKRTASDSVLNRH